MLAETGGDVTEAGEGHPDTMDEVVPPSGLQFAINVFDDQSGIAIGSVAPNIPRSVYRMMIEAAGLLSTSGPGR
jgi:hypothetical protein